MSINVSQNNPRAAYTATAGQTAFTVSFVFYESTDLTVYKNGSVVNAADYTVSGGNGATGTVTLDTGAVLNDEVVIVRDVPIERTTDLTSSYNASSIDDQLDRIAVQIADLNDLAGRSLKVNDWEVDPPLTLPSLNTRKGKVLGFNLSTGAMEATLNSSEVGALAGITGDISALAALDTEIGALYAIRTDIDDLGSIAPAITAVNANASNVTATATNIANVNLVGASIADVNDVADSLGEISYVYNKLDNIDTVALGISNVNTVASNIAATNAVGSNIAAVTSVNASLTQVGTVHTNIANVNVVGNSIDDVNDVAVAITDVTTVSDGLANINTVAGIAGNVSTVAGISSSVSTVAGITGNIASVVSNASNISTTASGISNINSVASSISNVNTVAGNIGNVNTVALDSADISTVAGIAGFVPTLSNVSNEIFAVAGNLSKITTVNSNAASITTVANNITDVNTVAGISGSVSTVAGITGNIASVVGDSAEINTVAGISSNVTSVASNASNINTVSANISNVNTVAGISADIQSVADRLPSVETALDNFDDIYLGPKSSAPTLDNDGDALLTGALYFNTSNTTMFVWDGNSWEPTPAQNFIDPNTELTQDLNTDTYDILFGDNAKAIFGADSDLQIYYQSSTNGSYVKGSGQTYIQGSNLYFKNGNGNQTYIYCANNGGVSLQHGSASDTKFATTPTGVNVTGNATFGDNGKAIFGASSDLQIYHDGNNSFIQDSGTGDLIVRASNNLYLQSYAGAENYLTASTNGAVTLYYDNAPKLATTSTGIDVTGTVTAGSYDLDAIAASKAVTAVDVFVYDTSKDSDGGAWRKRTQNTSWYNETLNTATRGSRKEFPAVAVIVYSSSSKDITIYDGDDPDMPMWMVFQDGGGEMLYAGGTPSSVTALNGEIVSGQYGVGALCHFNFIKDYGYVRINSSSEYNGSNIAKRNNNFSSDTVTGTTGALVSRSIYDVAMTVLPNAPIDAATGLPVPTIAVATDGGVSVIKDDGTVWDLVTGTVITNVSIGSDNGLVASRSQGTNYQWFDIGNITSDNQTVDDTHFATSSPALLGSALKNNYNTFGSSNGLTLFDFNTSAPANGMVAYVTSSYNTGYQNGDIKLATLSDTDATNVTGSELVTNGTFDSNITGWSGYTGIVADSGRITHDTGGDGGRIKLTNDTSGTSNARASQGFTTTIGKRYIATADLVAGTSTAMYLIKSNNANLSSGTVASTSSNETLKLEFEATTTTTYIGVANVNSTSGHTMFADNISVRLAEADRSVNGKGLQVFGTITKSAVATGAELVAYSGFSSSNYLEQPYNSALDFGTGDFCVMGWAKGTDTNGRLLLRADPADDQNRFSVDVSSGVIRFFTFDTTSALIESGYTIGDNWVFVCALRTGGYQYIYINGTSMGTPVASTKNVTNSNAVVTLGEDTRLSTPYAGSLALWRISATAPSAEQIKKIYEDEKVLFQDGAQATLYGSSDAVTALAYDDSTNILSVGTSAGRSDFQGLRRVNNTTTAVTSAISASNGLIVEQ